MKTIARVQDGRVVELVTSGVNILTSFHPALVWVDVTSVMGIAEGWTYDGSTFSKPIVRNVIPPPITISAAPAQLATLTADLETLVKKS